MWEGIGLKEKKEQLILGNDGESRLILGPLCCCAGLFVRRVKEGTALVHLLYQQLSSALITVQLAMF